MNDKQAAALDAIKMTAGLEAQRIALAAVNQAVQLGMLPACDYSMQVEVKIEQKFVRLAQ